MMAVYVPVELRCMGSFFGYPRCCIDAFYDWDKRSAYSEFHGTGFIPCKECVKKPYDELLAEIQRNRICKAPFPMGTSVLKRGRFEEYAPFTAEYTNYINGIDDDFS